MDRDVEMARAALANVTDMPNDTINSSIEDLGEGGKQVLETSGPQATNEAANMGEPNHAETSAPAASTGVSDPAAAPVPQDETNTSSAAPASDAVLGTSRETTTQPSEPAPAAAAELAAGQQSRPNRLQLIDEEQCFHGQEFQKQLAEWNMADVGFGYDLCAVLGMCAS